MMKLRSTVETIGTALALTVIAAAVSLLLWAMPSFAQSVGMTVSGSLTSASVGQTYSADLQSNGGVEPIVFTESGNLPAGMSWVPSSAGVVLSGVPSSGGSYPLAVTATDAIGQSASWTGTLTVANRVRPSADAPPASPTVSMNEVGLAVDFTGITIGLTIQPATVPSGIAGEPYPTTTFTSPGYGSINFTESGSLPQGLTATSGSNDMVLSGTPTQSGTYIFTINVVDQYGHKGSQSYTLTIAAPPPLIVTPSTIPGTATVGQTYLPVQQFQGSGGSGTSTVALTSGSVPAGMTFTNIGQNSAAILLGTPTFPSIYTFTVTATDSLIAGNTASQTYTIDVLMPQYTITPGSFPTAISGQSYSLAISIVGNPAGYTLTMTNAAGLPPGLVYSASGETVTIAGTPPNVSSPTSYGPFLFFLTDQYGNTQILQIGNLTAKPAPVATIALTTTPSAPVYTDQITLNLAATGNYPSVPTGTITGTLDGTARSINLTLANGQATLPVGRLTPGTHTLTYSYSGDSVYPGTGSTVAGAPAVSTATATFTVAYPPYYLTGTSFGVATGVGYYDAIDSSDNVYIADTGGNVIRKYDTSGNLTVVPTTGLNQPRGIVFDGSGNLYIADAGNNRIVELAPNGTQTVLSMGTLLPALIQPDALAFDSSYQNLWIVDYGNNRLVEYNLASQSTGITTGFSGQVYSVAVAPNGTVYAGTLGCGGVYKSTPGSGTAINLSLPPSKVCGASGLAFDRSGNLYIDDNYNDELYLMDASGNLTLLLSTVAFEFAVDSQSNVWLIDYNLNEFVPGPASNAGYSKSPGGSQGYGGEFQMYFQSPAGSKLNSVSVPANGGYNGGSVLTLYGDSNFAISYLDKTPIHPGQQNSVATATFSDGTVLKVPIYGSDYNTELGISPGTVSQVTTSTTNSTTHYGGMALDPNSNVYFSDTAANQVYEVSGGTVTPVGFTGLNAPTQVAVDGAGDVFVLDSGTNRILEYNNTGTPATETTTVAFDLSTQTALSTLTAFALDGATNLYLAGANSSGQGQIQKLSALGGYSTYSTGLAAVPTALALDLTYSLYSGDATGTVTQFTRSGSVVVRGTLQSGLGPITSMAIEPSGTVYATTSGGTNLTVVSPQGVVSSHSLAGVANALLVAEDNTGTLTVADGTTGQLFSEVRDPILLYPYGDQTLAFTYNFPATVVGTASPVQSYTLTNIGTTLDLDGYQGLKLLGLPNRQNFPQAAPTTCVAGTTVLSAGGSCVLSYTFSPTFAGADSEYDFITYSTPTNYSTQAEVEPVFTGFGVSQYANPQLSAAGATPFSACTYGCPIGFGNVVIGQSETLALTVTNIGAGTLQLSSIINNAGSAFTYDASNCGTSLAGATISNGTVTNTPSCIINITFKPTFTGGDGGPFYLIDNAGGHANSEQSISLGGTGVSASPVLTLPANITAAATSANGAAVTYSATATDPVYGTLTPSCMPASGSTFPIGTTTVTCSVTDPANNTATGSFTVTVQDTTAPVITVPANITTAATSTSGAVVTYSATATDLVDGTVSVSCMPASGSTFPIGTTTVNCTATDTHTNQSHASFTVTVQDTTPPVITVPPNITTAATSASGAVVTYTVTAVDLVGVSITPSCMPASGSTFPIGTTTVNCTATDSHANQSSKSFTVTVQDTTPPVITVPANITVAAASSSGAVVTYTATATDLVDGSDPVSCTPASGSTFPIGATTVNCTAADAHNNTSHASFTVTVQDTTPSVITVPANITTTATSASGAVVNYTATATDLVDGSDPVSCTPASGSTFPIGATTVNCTATDAHNNTSHASFTVTVLNTTPPVITVPANVTTTATSASGAVVNYTATATDLVDGPIAPSCTPASGSTFPIATTTVTCTATDSAHNTSTASFTVTVQPQYVFVVNSAGSVSSLNSYDGSVHRGAVAGGGIGAAVDRNGLVFSLTADGTGVSIFYDNGTLEATEPNGLTGASALAIDGGDQLWIAAPGSVSMGQILGSAQVSYTDTTLQKPGGVTIDLSGNVWITDSQSNTVHEFVGGGLPTPPLANDVQSASPATEP